MVRVILIYRAGQYRGTFLVPLSVPSILLKNVPFLVPSLLFRVDRFTRDFGNFV